MYSVADGRRAGGRTQRRNIRRTWRTISKKRPRKNLCAASTFLRRGTKGCGRSARYDFRGKRFAALAAKQIAGELGERVLVDLALEIDYRFQGYPVVVPAPGVEFRSLRRP